VVAGGFGGGGHTGGEVSARPAGRQVCRHALLFAQPPGSSARSAGRLPPRPQRNPTRDSFPKAQALRPGEGLPRNPVGTTLAVAEFRPMPPLSLRSNDPRGRNPSEPTIRPWK
jgi:hypothetical protein